MKKLRFGLLIAAGALLPLTLAVAAVLISGVGASTTPIVPLPAGASHEAGSTPDESPIPSQSPTPSASESPSTTPTVDDHGDRCSEPEHSNDPTCDSDSSGSSGGSGGSGSGDDSGSSGSSGSSGGSSGSSGDDD
jgi:uncharacterized membrane protein YgcG